jgi:hypothetical protein
VKRRWPGGIGQVVKDVVHIPRGMVDTAVKDFARRNTKTSVPAFWWHRSAPG